MRKLTNEELISAYFAINVHNEYLVNGASIAANVIEANYVNR